ncbi:serine protease filzig isoform X2 [Cylas formicarius]|uniref:serine protease filzig isoform X2 n=1 Tax=Cylas formicarius TaxID=197179 RepID=UPI002958677F|nr:serine protease filzig isoform X2 [Cylas formicarius]
MSPLFIVGITLFTTSFAAVDHVPQTKGNSPSNPHEINDAFETKNPQDFWWMRDDSPLKASYDYYKKCASSGQCNPSKKTRPSKSKENPSAGSESIDVAKNVFLNGQFNQNGGYSSASFTSASASDGCDGDCVQGTKIAGFHNGASIDLSKNPFLRGQYVAAGQDGEVSGVSASHCEGNGRVCAPIGKCLDGVIDDADVSELHKKGRKCDTENEVCCRLSSFGTNSRKPSIASNVNDLVYTAGKSSVQGSFLKFAGGFGLSPGQIQVISNSEEGVRPNPNFIGQSASSTLKSIRDISASASNNVFSSTPDYSNVQFDSNVRFASTLQGPAYLPPYEEKPTPTTPKPSCGPGYYVTPSGQCENIKKPCPPGSRSTPSGGCELIPSSTCRPDQRIGPYGQCVDLPSPPTPSTPRPCGPGQTRGPYGQCLDLPPPPTPSTPKPCEPGQTRGEYGQCVYLPPPPTSKPCGPGQTRGPYGQCGDLPPPPTPSTPRPCGPGQTRGPYGQCVDLPPPPTPSTPRPCGPGQTRGPYGQCVDLPTPPTPSTPRPCGPGQTRGPYGQCVDLPTPPTPSTPRPCGPGQTRGPYGQCVDLPPPPTPSTPRPCGPGQTRDPYGQCVDLPPPPTPSTPRPCGPGQTIGPYGQCVDLSSPPTPSTPRPCGPGQRRGPYGQCVDLPSPPTPKPCGPGQTRGAYGQCVDVPPPPTPPTPRPCGSGQKRGPYGECIEIITPTPTTRRPYCAAGQRLGPNGQCYDISTSRPRTCSPGQQLGPYGECIPIRTPPPRPTCPPGSFPTASGRCQRPKTTPAPPPRPICPPGSFLGPNGNCERPQPPPTPKPCPLGTVKSPTGECIRPAPTCPPGSYLGPSGSCVLQTRPSPPPTATTPRGYLPPKIETTTAPPSGGYVYPKPTPPFDTPGYDSGTNIESDYLNKKPPYEGSGSTINNNVVTPDRNPENTENTQVIVSPPAPDGSYTICKFTGNYTGPSKCNGGGSPTPGIPPNRPGSTRKPPSPGEYQSQSEIDETLIPNGCAAALKCVQEIYCTAEGVVSPVPVVLTREQELLRAPTTVCRDTDSGIIGKCCRDPNYVDPWPSANLVDGVDDGQYKEDDSIGQYKAQYGRVSRSNSQTRGLEANRRPKRQTNEDSTCGKRNYNTSPSGRSQIDANFAEIPWQAMILRQSNRSLLCGGVIIRRNAVLTAAHCVQGLETSDVLIKGGEWKLGIDEEPLPFQIVKVSAILRHPFYREGSMENDMAVLVLDEDLRFTKNIGELCLPAPNQIPTQNCIVTGWGKRILQLHARGAIMHRIELNVMDNRQCREMLGKYFPDSVAHYNPNTLCGFSDVDQCRVDYGSALACADDSGRYTLSGIYTWDTGCKQQGQIGGYVAPDVEWIEFVLSKPLGELKRMDREYNNRIQRST